MRGCIKYHYQIHRWPTGRQQLVVQQVATHSAQLEPTVEAVVAQQVPGEVGVVDSPEMELKAQTALVLLDMHLPTVVQVERHVPRITHMVDSVVAGERMVTPVVAVVVVVTLAVEVVLRRLE